MTNGALLHTSINSVGNHPVQEGHRSVHSLPSLFSLLFSLLFSALPLTFFAPNSHPAVVTKLTLSLPLSLTFRAKSARQTISCCRHQIEELKSAFSHHPHPCCSHATDDCNPWKHTKNCAYPPACSSQSTRLRPRTRNQYKEFCVAEC